ncbi:MAG: hypothetical protein FVQ80_16855 [Planctomycetes bacterium]|nr:hypothetical protein [Planctomycetota bacterium]
MKIQTNTVIKVLEIFFLSANFIFAQNQDNPPSIDPEREVIVMFKSDAVTPPENRTAGRPDENGGEIAFRVGGILYVMDLSTGSTWKVTEPAWGSFRWSPDGEWIVFEEGSHIYRIKVNGDSLAQLTFQGHNFFPPGDLMGSGSRMTQILTTQNMFGSRFIG